MFWSHLQLKYPPWKLIEIGEKHELEKLTIDDFERFLLNDAETRSKIWKDKDIEAEIAKYREKKQEKVVELSSEDESPKPKRKPATRGRGRGRGRAKKT